MTFSYLRRELRAWKKMQQKRGQPPFWSMLAKGWCQRAISGTAVVAELWALERATRDGKTLLQLSPRILAGVLGRNPLYGSILACATYAGRRLWERRLARQRRRALMQDDHSPWELTDGPASRSKRASLNARAKRRDRTHKDASSSRDSRRLITSAPLEPRSSPKEEIAASSAQPTILL